MPEHRRGAPGTVWEGPGSGIGWRGNSVNKVGRHLREEAQRGQDSGLQEDGWVLWSEVRGKSQWDTQYGVFNCYCDHGVKSSSLQESLPCLQ